MNSQVWTVESVKEQLPDVPVLIGKKKYTGWLRGREKRFPKVHVEITKGNFISYELAWETVVGILNRNSALKP